MNQLKSITLMLLVVFGIKMFSSYYLQAKFQEINAAYKFLTNPQLRTKYDKSIGIFKGQAEISKDLNIDYLILTQEERYDKLHKESLKYRTLDDFMSNIEQHRALHEERTKLFREGWDDAVKKYGVDYEHSERVEEETKDKYVTYNEHSTKRNWDTKENHEYYSKSWLIIIKDEIVRSWKWFVEKYL